MSAVGANVAATAALPNSTPSSKIPCATRCFSLIVAYLPPACLPPKTLVVAGDLPPESLGETWGNGKLSKSSCGESGASWRWREREGRAGVRVLRWSVHMGDQCRHDCERNRWPGVS